MTLRYDLTITSSEAREHYGSSVDADRLLDALTEAGVECELHRSGVTVDYLPAGRRHSNDDRWHIDTAIVVEDTFGGTTIIDGTATTELHVDMTEARQHIETLTACLDAAHAKS